MGGSTRRSSGVLLLLPFVALTAVGCGDPADFAEVSDDTVQVVPATPTAVPTVPAVQDDANGTDNGDGSLADPGNGPEPGAVDIPSDLGGGDAGVPDAPAGDTEPEAASGGAGSMRGPDPTTASASTAGPFTVESYVDGYEDSPFYLDGTIWYPSDAEPPFAGVAVVPGFVSPQASTAPWGPYLASHGFVSITIGTNTGADPPEVRSEALLAALDTLRAEHVRAGSPLEGKIDESRFAIMGWSMGGGGALIASSTHPELKAAITLAAWRPAGLFNTSTVPTLLFAATTDPLAAGQSQGFYASIPETTPKLLIEVVSADHWLFNDPNNLGGEIGRFGLSWLKVFVEGDERYREFIDTMPTVPLGSFEKSL